MRIKRPHEIYNLYTAKTQIIMDEDFYLVNKVFINFLLTPIKEPNPEIF